MVVAHGLSCSVACGIFPNQGSNPCPLHWQADSQPLCQQGSPMSKFLCRHIFLFLLNTYLRMELLGHMVTIFLTFLRNHQIVVFLFFCFVFFWLRWVFVAALGLSPVVASGGYSSLRCVGFSCCGARALGTRASVVEARRLSSCGTWALGCVGSVVLAHGV